MSCCVFLRPLSTLFVLGKKHLEAVVHLSQFPENRKKLDCDYEQQELDNHFLASRGQEMSYVREPHYQHGVIFFQLLSCVTISVQRSRLSLVRSSKRVSCVSCRSDFSPVIQLLGRFAIIPGSRPFPEKRSEGEERGAWRYRIEARGGANVTDFLGKLWSQEEGQDIAEYAVMLAVILVIVVGTLRLIGGSANNVFSATASSIGQ
jgi:Flp pilus assembly pilin Flp